MRFLLNGYFTGCNSRHCPLPYLVTPFCRHRIASAPVHRKIPVPPHNAVNMVCHKNQFHPNNGHNFKDCRGYYLEWKNKSWFVSVFSGFCGLPPDVIHHSNWDQFCRNVSPRINLQQCITLDKKQLHQLYSMIFVQANSSSDHMNCL